MKLKMLTGLSGSEFCLNPNDEHDFPQDEAERLIAAGFAIPVSTKAVETTQRQPAPETRAIAAAPKPAATKPPKRKAQ